MESEFEPCTKSSPHRYVSVESVEARGATQSVEVAPPPSADTLRWRGPTLVLVGETTGSAAEIFAVS